MLASGFHAFLCFNLSASTHKHDAIYSSSQRIHITDCNTHVGRNVSGHAANVRFAVPKFPLDGQTTTTSTTTTAADATRASSQKIQTTN